MREGKTLRFSPSAWAKLVYLRDLGSTEVGGFGITHPQDPFYVMDFVTVKQSCSAASVSFDDDALSEMIENFAIKGIQPFQCSRVWIHTHPGNSATPSGLDESTYKDKFGGCDWAVMFILAKDGNTSCRMLTKVQGHPLHVNLGVEIDYMSYDFAGSDYAAWKKEYETNVQKQTYVTGAVYEGYGKYARYKHGDDDGEDYSRWFQSREPQNKADGEKKEMDPNQIKV